MVITDRSALNEIRCQSLAQPVDVVVHAHRPCATEKMSFPSGTSYGRVAATYVRISSGTAIAPMTIATRGRIEWMRDGTGLTPRARDDARAPAATETAPAPPPPHPAPQR